MFIIKFLTIIFAINELFVFQNRELLLDHPLDTSNTVAEHTVNFSKRINKERHASKIFYKFKDLISLCVYSGSLFSAILSDEAWIQIFAQS